MSSALPYFGAVRDVVEPCGLSTCIECSEVYVVTSGGAEWFSIKKHRRQFSVELYGYSKGSAIGPQKCLENISTNSHSKITLNKHGDTSL